MNPLGSFGTFLFQPSEEQILILMDMLGECKVPFLIVHGLATPDMVEAMRAGVRRSEGRGMSAVWARQHGTSSSMSFDWRLTLMSKPFSATRSVQLSLCIFLNVDEIIGHFVLPDPLRSQLSHRKPLHRCSHEYVSPSNLYSVSLTRSLNVVCWPGGADQPLIANELTRRHEVAWSSIKSAVDLGRGSRLCTAYWWKAPSRR